jgi:hypothetical protein
MMQLMEMQLGGLKSAMFEIYSTRQVVHCISLTLNHWVVCFLWIRNAGNSKCFTLHVRNPLASWIACISLGVGFSPC